MVNTAPQQQQRWDIEQPASPSRLDDESAALISRHTTREGSIQSGLPESIPPLPGMKIRCHRLEKKNGSLTDCTTKEALAGAKSGKHHYWIDIDAHCHRYYYGYDSYQNDDYQDSINTNSAELRSWLNQLESLPNFVIDMLADHPDTWASQVIPLPRAVLAVIRILPPNTSRDDVSNPFQNPNGDEMAHLAALCLRNMLITFSSSSSTGKESYSMVLQRMRQAERLPAATSRGALLAWLRFHLDRTSKSTRDLRHFVVNMDEAMDRKIDTVSLEEIIEAKDQLLRILSVAEEQSECLESLVAVTTADNDDFKSLKGSMSILLAAAGATERMALRLEKHIMDLRQRCEGHEQHMMNRRLAVLTVLSAVFLPLTLFTGIWGMNFSNMPELNEPYAYPVALMFMMSIAFVMICYFRTAGWFD